ncbi:hypothetical protein B0T24DRAFT_610864 [Lasiosphaeria ovina]|uniref:Uncharacterized protein n=1 Tax=Lasiosphaeria ovina TaxID=92902 RepID=A0AAE0KMZ0_9PEZI|nr:hypothetical protein B0T24DRAFT_610864 [Lasiosphaeria ovina]
MPWKPPRNKILYVPWYVRGGVPLLLFWPSGQARSKGVLFCPSRPPNLTFLTREPHRNGIRSMDRFCGPCVFLVLCCRLLSL